MGETFFTSKDAAKITGCTLRQLQYWREKGVIVPMVSATGTGRSVYYSRSELVELAVMVYLLSVGLTFESASGVLQQLRELEPNFAKENSQRRLMLVFDTSEGILKLKDFERESAIAFLDRGEAIIPLWLEQIHQQLNQTLPIN
ncbi:putative transcriptional regulator, MerR family [Rippkaea orientalis PCC 8801]|uniref:Putative transcriptional regulator, MerR family n=1 Tax=Rippkaea orientalis (strain PCC 8801 / RF-1) TaxID=41431 RepID=B7K142_RIPO1|nr:MerR family transcriptional regulator [Rippkaea orientalis]ACK66237.1 putative transcriptional regulator, MerR family [Rippkaea orientalis PCC 8801]